MLDFLSSKCWIEPQIDFLLILQNIRLEHFEFLNKFFLSITVLGEVWFPTVICAIVYWCIDTRSGLYLFSLSSLNVFFAHLFKMVACVYRPWILSDKIHPVDEAFALAKGYSFPSGHSAKASAVLGGLAYLHRHKKSLCLFLIVLILVVGFSRLWLGVHTPQDVVVGLLIGSVLVFIMNSLIKKAEENKNLYTNFLFIIDILACFAILYVCYFNKYPIDYVNGKLLVSPISSKQTFVLCYGYLLGIINGAFLTRRFFPFEASAGSLKSKIFRGVFGAFSIYILFRYALRYLFCNVVDFKIVFILPFCIGFFITAVYPYIFLKLQKLYK